MDFSPLPSSEDDRSPLAVPLTLVTRLVIRFPRATLIVAVVLALAALTYTALRLELRTSRLDLLNPHSAYNQLWLRYIDEFGDQDDVVVVVEGDDTARITAVMDEIAKVLSRETDHFAHVLHKVDLTRLRAKGLYQLDPQQLAMLDRQLDRFDAVLHDDWSQVSVGGQISQIRSRLTQPSERAEAIQQLEKLIHSLNTAVEGRTDAVVSPEFAQLDRLLGSLNTRYLLTGNELVGLVLLKLNNQQASFTYGSEAVGRLRQLIARLQSNNPDVKIGLTGLPVMENDEMVASGQASWRAGLLSLAGVGCLFAVGFGGMRHSLLAMAALLLAVVWSFGYVTLAVGHLNILSMAFGVILIGLGVDFGIHYIARYLDLRRQGAGSAVALIETASNVGPGIVAGGLTTALAFFAAGLTDFTGVVELGVIAGGGVLLCVASAMCVLPAMIQLFDRNRPDEPLPRMLDAGQWVAPLARVPRLMIVSTILVVAVLALGLSRLWYDHNLLNLQPPGLQSVDLERRLLVESDDSVWFAVSMTTDRDELLARKARFEALSDTVDHTEEIVSLLPPEVDARRPLVQHIAGRLATLPPQPAVLTVVEPSVLLRGLAEVRQLIPTDERNAPIIGRLDRLRSSLEKMSPDAAYALLAEYQRQTAAQFHLDLQNLRVVASTDPPDWNDLPEGLVSRFVGRRGQHLIKIYSKANIWDMQALERFVRDVRTVDHQVTGKPLQTYEASRQMMQSYIHAAFYALIAVFIVLVFEFRKLSHVLLAITPVGLGMLQLFGILGLVGLPLNPANMIVLPLILGIGIDDGVHVLHDYRRQTGRFRLSGSTATAVIMTSLTTMIGFGSLMIASHRGLYSLGRVLTIGVGCCLLSSLITLPAILQWSRSRRSDEEMGSEPATVTGRSAAARRLRRMTSNLAKS